MTDRVSLFRALRRARWQVVRTRRGHWRVYTPSGRLVATTSGTPSDHRAILNLVAVLRRAGWCWPPQSGRARR